MSLYGYLRLRAPARYVEIGSGYSTCFAARARRDGGLATEITSIDPEPRLGIDELCDRVVRQPLEEVDLDLFAELEQGDVVLFDSSHRVFMNSDAVAFHLDVLPALPAGVLVGVHDVYWPADYPPHLAQAYLSEQYLVGMLLLGDAAWARPVLACAYAAEHPELVAPLAALWDDPRLTGVERGGSLLWLAIER